MPHHKRKRPKHQRRGCLLCKPHKDERLAYVPKYRGHRRGEKLDASILGREEETSVARMQR